MLAFKLRLLYLKGIKRKRYVCFGQTWGSAVLGAVCGFLDSYGEVGAGRQREAEGTEREI